jgi:hypothetical protein
MKKLTILLGSLTLLAFSLPASAYTANITNTSGSFSLGFGDTSSWNELETLNYNTHVTGNFTLTSTLTGGAMTSAGVGFDGRTLQDFGGIFGSYVGEIIPFNASFAAAYTGASPDPDATNLRLQLNITSMTVWVFAGYGSPGTETVRFNETTAGNTQDSGLQAVTYTNLGLGTFGAANYEQHAWNPAEFTSTGLTQTRTFTMNEFGAFNDGAIDGYEIYGNVQLIYDVIPEPTSAMLLIAGAAMLWRKRS